MAWDTIRLKLQELIDNEDKQHPKSDDQLVKDLAAAGVTVARRTVTKYRKAMNIPSSRQRRDWSEYRARNRRKTTRTSKVAKICSLMPARYPSV